MAIAVSVVVPFFNEEETLAHLCDQVFSVLSARDEPFEIVFVNDGSTDMGAVVAQQLVQSRPYVHLINFRTNFGKAAALSAGFRRAKGEVVVTMDADLQDDPIEIPRFLAELDKGLAVLCGLMMVSLVEFS